MRFSHRSTEESFASFRSSSSNSRDEGPFVVLLFFPCFASFLDLSRAAVAATELQRAQIAARIRETEARADKPHFEFSKRCAHFWDDPAGCDEEHKSGFQTFIARSGGRVEFLGYYEVAKEAAIARIGTSCNMNLVSYCGFGSDGTNLWHE